jgi:hypothetical protein
VDVKKKDMGVLAACLLLFVGVNVALFVTGRFPERSGGLPDWTSTLGLMAAVAITFAMYSFLYKDNPFFRAAENLFVGLGLGVTFYVTWFHFFKPDIYDRLVVPLFEPAAQVLPSDAVLIIPIILGVLVLARVSPNHGWVSRYPIAFMIGYGAGFGIQPTFHSLVFKQVEKTMAPIEMPWLAWALFGVTAVAIIVGAYYASKGGKLAVVLKTLCAVGMLAYIVVRNTPSLAEDYAVAQAFRGVDSLLIMIGVVTVLCYFFFSAEHKGILGAASRVGIVFLMVSFGASFGYTVMARESLVIGRIQFLLGDWLGVL